MAVMGEVARLLLPDAVVHARAVDKDERRAGGIEVAPAGGGENGGAGDGDLPPLSPSARPCAPGRDRRADPWGPRARPTCGACPRRIRQRQTAPGPVAGASCRPG